MINNAALQHSQPIAPRRTPGQRSAIHVMSVFVRLAASWEGPQACNQSASGLLVRPHSDESKSTVKILDCHVGEVRLH